jgi:hypothetical protein
MVSQAPCRDRNPRGARGLFGPPKNKKSYFSDFFFSNVYKFKGMIFLGVVNKDNLVFVEFYHQNLFQKFREKMSKSDKSHTKITLIT